MTAGWATVVQRQIGGSRGRPTKHGVDGSGGETLSGSWSVGCRSVVRGETDAYVASHRSRSLGLLSSVTLEEMSWFVALLSAWLWPALASL